MTIAAFQKRIAGTHGQRIAWTSEQIERIARHYGIDASHTGLPMLAPRQRHIPELVLRDTSTDGRTFNFVASNGETDRMADQINPNGWLLSDFRRNPVCLFAHDSSSLPCGRVVSVGVQNNQLLASVKFASTGLGRAVAAMYAGDFMKAVSVGFAPGQFEFAKEKSRAGGINFTSGHTLLELSCVPIPANSNALLQNITGDGKSLSSAKAKLKRQRELDLVLVRLMPAPRGGCTRTKAERLAELAEMRKATR